jgi:hypothetical protein
MWNEKFGSWYHRYSYGSACELSAEPIEEWITPTDEDAKSRPTVQVRDSADLAWVERELIAVTTATTGVRPNTYVDHYITFAGDKSRTQFWAQCRMKKE